MGSGQQLLLPADFSNSPEQVTRIVAFQAIVADVDGLYQDGMISLPEKQKEMVSGRLFVVEVFVEKLTAFGKDVLAIYEPPAARHGPGFPVG